MRFVIKLWIFAVAFFFLITAEPVHAKMWQGPAWYMVNVSAFGVTIWAGPYASEAACKAAMPDRREWHEWEEYSCDYLKADIDD
jgi:hypothetical protein